MNILDIISKTKHKIPLEKSEIRFLVENYTNGNIPDYQMSAWLMAVCLNSLNDDETAELT
ncbi:MAG: thymidine phosphorylase, partial [Ruminococcus sp.]